MPAFVTHHLFADSVYKALPEGAAKRAVAQNYDAFLWGCQGPDVLFFNKISTVLPLWGFIMHVDKVQENMVAMQRYLLRTRQGLFFGQQLAYCLGFLCHYALDKNAHPYVYYLQHAFMKKGEAGAGVHNRIESDIDTVLYRQLTGRSVGRYVIPKSMFHPATTRGVALILTYLLKKVYFAKTNVNKVENSFVWDNFFMTLFVENGAITHRGGVFLDSFCKKKYGFSGYMRREPVGWDCLNLRHHPWCNLNSPGSTCTLDFYQIMGCARQEACTMINAFLHNLRHMSPRAVCGTETFDNGKPEK